MVKGEYLRYIKSKFNLILFSVLLTIGLISYYESFSEKQMFISQRTSGAEDINYEMLELIISEYTGMKFLINFLFDSEFFQIFVMVLIAGMAIFLCIIPFNQKESGFGNIILTRVSYKQYIGSVLLAQMLYIVTLIISVILLLLIVGFFIGGFSFEFGSIGERELPFLIAFLYVMLHTSVLIVYVILVSSISSLIMVFLNNKYLIQVSPFILFIIIPVVLGSTVANLSSNLGNLIYNIIPFVILSIVPDFLTTDIGLEYGLLKLVPLILMFFIGTLLYKVNVDKFSRDYL